MSIDNYPKQYRLRVNYQMWDYLNNQSCLERTNISDMIRKSIDFYRENHKLFKKKGKRKTKKG
jgi:hypothetical protein